MTTRDDFAQRLLAWHARYGRHDLPWQHDKSPYRVWVSEIMLQQTQVATVIPYFERFMNRFPDVRTLAAASEDELMHYWTGLGYYARARNLHRAARMIHEDFAGEFPAEIATLCSLPGIGRSTAGAIRSIAFGLHAPILDGNVKRVLARFHGIDLATGGARAMKQLWEIAESGTPRRHPGEYAQAIMDLGATLCTRSRPRCDECPLASNCTARRNGEPGRYPGSKRSKRLPERSCRMLLIRNCHGEILLEKRPSTGLWGGLWSFPQIEKEADSEAICLRLTGSVPSSIRDGAAFRHTFSHFHLDITPSFLELSSAPTGVMESPRLIWYKPGSRALGFAAPVKRLIEALSDIETHAAEQSRP